MKLDAAHHMFLGEALVSFGHSCHCHKGDAPFETACVANCMLIALPII